MKKRYKFYSITNGNIAFKLSESFFKGNALS